MRFQTRNQTEMFRSKEGKKRMNFDLDFERNSIKELSNYVLKAGFIQFFAIMNN